MVSRTGILPPLALNAKSPLSRSAFYSRCHRNLNMSTQIVSNTKNATSTVSPVAEIDPKEERSLVCLLTLSQLSVWNTDLSNTGMASGYLLLDYWLSRLCIQVPRSNQHCMFIRNPEEYPILTTHQSNAYVSGMQTDLELHGNELNYFTTFFK